MSVLGAICVLSATAACGRTPSSRAEEARTAIRSWDATLALLEHERARGAVPERFAAEARRTAAAERRKAEARLQQVGER